MINYYIILEIPNFSEEPIIKKAYRTLSKKYHPDVNKDSSAVDYFLKVKEAYEFLMNENKRLLLNQFLIAGHQSQRVYQQSETFYQAPPKPVIHYFSTDRKNFALGDYVLIQWNISQCKSVFINMIGNVEFSGTHYLKIENFIDELVILMTIKGLDDVEYKYQIKLFYKDDNPYRAAFAQRIKLGHKINAKHFVKENEFSRYGRIDKKTLQRRILKCAFFMTLGLWFNYAVVHNPLLVGVLFISAGWYVLHQLIKRYQDLNGYKSINWTDVFVKEPYSKTNNYGLSPASLPKIASRFSQIGTLGKWSFYSLGILLFSYIFPLIVPNYHSVEFPESISFYTIKRNSGDEIAYVLHFTDFQTHIKTNTAIGIKRGVVDEFYVARSFLLNKPLYIELQSSKGVILKENRYYVGMNDYQNTSVIFVFIFIFFQIWLVYNVKDKRMQLFRNISFVMLTLLYLWTALKEWW